MKQYVINMLMAVDQFASTVLGGHPDDTISQRLGRAKLAGGGPLINFFVKAVDTAAFILVREKQHCLRSLNGKSKAREIWNWGGNRSMTRPDCEKVEKLDSHDV